MNFAILAAGRGDRLAQAGITVAKPLVPVGGVPMIRRLVGLLGRCGAERIDILAPAARPEVGAWIRSQQWEVTPRVTEAATAHPIESLALLARQMDRTASFCLMTVDTVFEPGMLRRFVAGFEADASAQGHFGVSHYRHDEKPLWVEADSEGRIRGFHDTAAGGSATAPVSAGVYALRPEAFAVIDRTMAQGATRLRDFQRALLQAGMSLRAVDMGRVLDVDDPGDLALANRAEALLTDIQN